METNRATLGFLGFPIGISKVTVLPESNLDTGGRSVNIEASSELLYLVIQFVFSLGGDNKQPVDSPVIIIGSMVFGRLVFRSQKLGIIGAFEDHVLVHAPDVQFIIKLVIPTLYNQLQFSSQYTAGEEVKREVLRRF